MKSGWLTQSVEGVVTLHVLWRSGEGGAAGVLVDLAGSHYGELTCTNTDRQKTDWLSGRGLGLKPTGRSASLVVQVAYQPLQDPGLPPRCRQRWWFSSSGCQAGKQLRAGHCLTSLSCRGQWWHGQIDSQYNVNQGCCKPILIWVIGSDICQKNKLIIESIQPKCVFFNRSLLGQNTWIEDD